MWREFIWKNLREHLNMHDVNHARFIASIIHTIIWYLRTILRVSSTSTWLTKLNKTSTYLLTSSSVSNLSLTLLSTTTNVSTNLLTFLFFWPERQKNEFIQKEIYLGVFPQVVLYFRKLSLILYWRVFFALPLL